MRGDEGFGNRGGFDEAEVARDGGDQALVGDHVLSLSAAADDAENTVAGLERAHDVRPQGIDFAGILEPRDVGGGTREGLDTPPCTATSPPDSIRRRERESGPGRPVARALELRGSRGPPGRPSR